MLPLDVFIPNFQPFLSELSDGDGGGAAPRPANFPESSRFARNLKNFRFS
jgi:hypothetical protein